MISERFANNRVVRSTAAISMTAPLMFGGSISDTTEVCEVVPDSVIEATTKLYADTWEPPYQAEGPQTIEQVLTLPPNTMEEKIAVATELGLTIYDYKTEFNELRLAAGREGEDSIPMSEYFAKTSEFLARYGIELVTKETAVAEDLVLLHSATLVSYDDLIDEDSSAVKRELIGYVASLGELPVEFIEHTGLKRIVLVNIPASGIGGYADIHNLDLGTIYADPSKYVPGMIPHEDGHLDDARECGPSGMYIDTQYDEINPVDKIYENHDGYMGDLELETSTELNDLKTRLRQASSAAEKEAIQGEIDALERAVVVSSNYGFTNIVEDKATIKESIFSGNSRDLIEDSDSPVVQDKAILEMSRLAMDKPKLVEYFARTSKSTHTTNPFDPPEGPSPSDIPAFLSSN